MNKILLPIDPDQYPQELLDFAARLNPVCPMLLTAAFVPLTDYAGLFATAEGAVMDAAAWAERNRTIHHQRSALTDFCQEAGIRAHVHIDDKDFALPSLASESRFADLLLMDSESFFRHQAPLQPNNFMRNMLHNAECPVLLLPKHAGLPEEVVLTYDGTAHSMSAIRRFSYLFPAFRNIQTTLVYITGTPASKMPHEEQLREWGLLHFNRCWMETLPIQGDESLFTSWIASRKNPWVITGSFGRSAFSEVFYKSFSTALIRQHSVPVFISHG